MNNTNFTRANAIKVPIQAVLRGTYIQEKEQNPNYLQIENEKIVRLNIIATVVYKEEVGSMTTVLLDDATGRIIIRFFEESMVAREIGIGEVVLVIGKVRVYNQEKYISPEIVKRVDSMWLKVRALELNENPLTKNYMLGNVREDVFTEEEVEINNELLPFEKIIFLIKELDKGEGVLIEEIIDKSPLEGTEQWIEKMLERGDIFQNQPGKVKVL